MLYLAESVPTLDEGDRQCIKWNVNFGGKYDKQKHAIVISETGFYFMYLSLHLRCHVKVGIDVSSNFVVELQKWNVGYNKTITLAGARESVACTPEFSRTLFVGELFELLEGDHVSVNVKEGYRMIMKSSFGAYLV